jgi:hypothetical protein
MSHGMIYAGQEAFDSALVEVDDTKMHERILESTTAIEHRLLNSIDLHNTEFKEMITATITLVVLGSVCFTARPMAKERPPDVLDSARINMNEAFNESNDLEPAWREWQSKTIGLYVGRNAEGHDKVRHGKAPSRPGERYAEIEPRRSGEMG